MKKLLSFILAFILIVGLASCGASSKIPEGFDQALYDYAVAAYELVHDYNLGKVDKAAAKERAETIAKNVEALPVPANNTKWSDSTFKLTYEQKQLGIALALQSFSYDIVSGSSSVDEEASLKNLIGK